MLCCCKLGVGRGWLTSMENCASFLEDSAPFNALLFVYCCYSLHNLDYTLLSLIALCCDINPPI
jgi:hypothetical protein